MTWNGAGGWVIFSHDRQVNFSRTCLCAAGWFGWYENPKIEQLTQEWLDAKDEDATCKGIALSGIIWQAAPPFSLLRKASRYGAASTRSVWAGQRSRAQRLVARCFVAL
jgi:hypothetical protein